MEGKGGKDCSSFCSTAQSQAEPGSNLWLVTTEMKAAHRYRLSHVQSLLRLVTRWRDGKGEPGPHRQLLNIIILLLVVFVQEHIYPPPPKPCVALAKSCNTKKEIERIMMNVTCKSTCTIDSMVLT